MFVCLSLSVCLSFVSVCLSVCRPLSLLLSLSHPLNLSVKLMPKHTDNFHFTKLVESLLVTVTVRQIKRQIRDQNGCNTTPLHVLNVFWRNRFICKTDFIFFKYILHCLFYIIKKPTFFPCYNPSSILPHPHPYPPHTYTLANPKLIDVLKETANALSMIYSYCPCLFKIWFSMVIQNGTTEWFSFILNVD